MSPYIKKIIGYRTERADLVACRTQPVARRADWLAAGSFLGGLRFGGTMTRAARPRSRSKWRAWLDADWASACLLHKIDCWLFRRVDSLNMDIVCAPKLGVELLITQAHEGLCFGLRPTRQSLFPSKWAVEREREREFSLF
jgi:hypothetical protein